jgi:hypothetical protein
MKTFTIIFLTLFTFLFSEIHDISISGFAFNPNTLEIYLGDTVRWTNNDSFHRVVSDDEVSFESENLSNGDTFEHPFDAAGEFPYHCGIHSSMTAEITVVDESLNNDGLSFPDKITINPAYPNPFNPSTNISFSLDQYYGVSIDIYNLRGELVSNLLKRGLVAGNHSVVWNASHESAGVYLLKVSTDNFISTQKVMLIK